VSNLEVGSASPTHLPDRHRRIPIAIAQDQ
jgi:hypothetical protein